MKDNYVISEYRIAREVLKAFRHVDSKRPLEDRAIFASSRATLREGGCLCIWPHENKVKLLEPKP